MRTLFGLFIALTLLSALLVTSPINVQSAPALALINLTKDSRAQRNPSIGWSLNGDVIVAWEQNVPINGVRQSDVLARVRQNGKFGPAFNISNNPAMSSEPSLFRAGQFLSMLYIDASSGISDIVRSDWSGTAWSTPQRVTGGDYASSLNPVGAQASDGSTWLTRWVRTVGNRSDIIVQQVGGPVFNVSNDGRGWRHPALVAGDNGEVYVAWIDHTYQPKGFTPGVRVGKVTPSGFVALPQPTNDYWAYWCTLAYRKGSLYVAWLATDGGLIHERVWDGSTWGHVLTLPKGDTPRIAVTPKGNVYVVWESGGQIYLQENSTAPQVVSGNLSKASQPALAVDGSENALVAFIAGGDVWFVQVPSQ